ncbi:hypothetical protein BJ508DRAFT_305653 [Ascobolus immersus RN42]|uniref:Uncharacterized protein n=1 Tax=Ascobolus immersus RN42 TaxID=1160509 RepID=A0A3N4IAN4_ASCIM|nr:hypothetical protein BJ508DRAFT_305653 [Ascobolus immersus RN42]
MGGIAIGKLMAFQIAALVLLSATAGTAATAKSKSHKRTQSGTQAYIAERLQKNEDYYESRYSSYSGQAPPKSPPLFPYSGSGPRDGVYRSLGGRVCNWGPGGRGHGRSARMGGKRRGSVGGVRMVRESELKRRLAILREEEEEEAVSMARVMGGV